MDLIDILKKLKPYLTNEDYSQLSIVLGYTISNTSKLVVAMVVSDICKRYNGTEGQEEEVKELLVKILKCVIQ